MTQPGQPKGKVLVVDDLDSVTSHLSALLGNAGYEVETASDGGGALQKMGTFTPDIVMLDVQMPIINGLEVCRIIRSRPETQLLPVVFITALEDQKTKVECYEAGCNEFLNKPFDSVELIARMRSLMQFKHLTDQLESAESVLLALPRALEAKDPYTRGHSQRVADYTANLAAVIGLPAEDQGRMRRAGLLHDIGKIGVRESVLNKAGKLEDEEFEHIKLHPIVGEEILRPFKSTQPYLPAVRHHHERSDGKGYPDGLRGEEIPLDAGLMAIADGFDAMTSHRPYRQAMPREKALAILAENHGPQWDGEFVRAFIAMIGKGTNGHN